MTSLGFAQRIEQLTSEWDGGQILAKEWLPAAEDFERAESAE